MQFIEIFVLIDVLKVPLMSLFLIAFTLFQCKGKNKNTDLESPSDERTTKKMRNLQKKNKPVVEASERISFHAPPETDISNIQVPQGQDKSREKSTDRKKKAKDESIVKNRSMDKNASKAKAVSKNVALTVKPTQTTSVQEVPKPEVPASSTPAATSPAAPNSPLPMLPECKTTSDQSSSKKHKQKNEKVLEKVNDIERQEKKVSLVKAVTSVKNSQKSNKIKSGMSMSSKKKKRSMREHSRKENKQGSPCKDPPLTNKETSTSKEKLDVQSPCEGMINGTDGTPEYQESERQIGGKSRKRLLRGSLDSDPQGQGAHNTHSPLKFKLFNTRPTSKRT